MGKFEKVKIDSDVMTKNIYPAEPVGARCGTNYMCCGGDHLYSDGERVVCPHLLNYDPVNGTVLCSRGGDK